MALRLVVESGEHERVQCPVSVVADLGGQDPRRLTLRAEGSAMPVPLAVAGVDGARWRLTWLLPLQPARTTCVYILTEAGAEVSVGPGVQLLPQAECIDVLVGGTAFTTFHYGQTWSRPFLHPLIGPYGDPVTRAYPVRTDVPGEKQDHPHHKSLWVAWGDVNGTDNWSENRESGHAKQVVRRLTACAAGPCCARLACLVDWVSEGGVKVLEEAREVVVWDMPASGRAIDLTVSFRASEGAVRFGDTKEGGLCSIRVASSMDASGAGTIVNSYGGTNEAETWGKRAHWCDYYGPVNGHTVGLAIFDHPSNFRYPTYWHVRNYGLMTANPFGLSHFLNDPTIDGSHTLAAGGVLTFRYRVYCHAGTTVAGAVAARYHDFVNPPKVVVAPG
jgi:hypothetical protein